MPAIQFTSASFSYTSAHVVLDDVDFTLGPGWTGVVGPNGAGKSTLLALAAGRLQPTSGSAIVDTGAPPILCRQRVERPDTSVEAFAASLEAEDFVLRGRLALDPSDLERWSTLSPGECKRWQVGAALAARPDVLLLDEPTNHLDAASRSILIAALARFRGVGLVVSHDRDLLARLTTSTLRVEGGRAELWGGSYEVAATGWVAADAARHAERNRTKRELAKTERRISDRRRTLDLSQAVFAKRMRTAAAKDHDLHSTARVSKHEKGMAAASRSLGNLAAERDRLAEQVAGTEVRRAVGGRISFRGRAAPRPVLVSVDGPLSAGARTLAAHLSCAVERDSRIHLRGPNGAGKSTLLSRLAQGWDLDPGRLLHLPQELDAHQGVALLTGLRRRPAEERGRILQLVARLGSDPEVLLASELPSPGEARKLAMAMGLATEAWLLLLDEPTNHLDLPTIERLEAALAEYPGALMVVSHDRAFAERVTESSWELAEGTLTT